MKILLPVFLCVCINTFNAFSQITWSKLLGGSSTEEGRIIEQTRDGNLIILGSSNSNDGNVSGNHGNYDFWLLKADGNNQSIIWQKSYGGSGVDIGITLQQTNDGGFILGGYSTSVNGDVSGNHGNNDFWVVKTDALGTMQWQKSLGGTGSDQCNAIQQTNDGGYILAGLAQSNDGEVSGNHGGVDCWIVKLDSSGNIIWQKCLGGTNDDYAFAIDQTSNGGYIITGRTNSNNGDVSGNNGAEDAWVAKLDSIGNIEWQKCFGDDEDDAGLSIIQSTDGDYVMSGYFGSRATQFTPYATKSFYVVKIDNSGNAKWTKTSNSSGGNTLPGYEEFGNSIIETNDGGFIVAGRTDRVTPSNDLSKKHFKVLRLFANGDIWWNHVLFGGTDYDAGYCVKQTSDGGFLLAGASNSNDADVSGNNGGRDLWIFKIGNLACSINASTVPSGTVTICNGDTQLLQAAPATGYTYKWLNNNVQVGTASSLQVTQAGSYEVIVSGGTSSHGTCAEKPASITVIVNPQPVCSITGDDIICSLETTEFIAASGAASYLWSGPNGFTGTSTNTGSINATGTYSVTATGVNGCSSSCSITLSPPPPGSCNVTGDNDICSNETTQFIVSGGVSYVWSGPGGFTANTAIIDSIMLAGNYSATVSDVQGCLSVCSRSLTVNSLPSCNVSVSHSICSYNTSSFVAAGGTSYTWSGPNGFSASGASAGIISAPGIYSVSISYANGCAGVCTRSLTHISVPCTITGDSVFCDNSFGVLNAPAGNSAYNWYDPQGFWSNNSNTLVQPGSEGVYTLITSKGGCTDTCSSWYVNSIPAPACIITGDSSICDYETASFTMSAGDSYSWIGPNGFTDNAATINSITTPGVYSVTVSASNSCSSDCSVNLSVNPSPALSITGDTLICANETTNFIVTGGISYSWSGPNGFSATTANTGGISGAGTYSVTGTDSKGCSSSDAEVLSLNSIPSVSISGDTAICANETSQFTASGGTSYSWTGPNGFSSNSASTGTINSDGDYVVTVTDNNGCHETGSRPLNVKSLTNPEICIVGVDSATGKNMLVWEKPVTTAIDSYIIYRETSQANFYERIGAQAYDEFSTFVDNQSIPEQNSNKYKLEIIDTCGLSTTGTNSHTTIHLSINQGVGSTWNLIWNHYEGFAFSTYNIYRGTSSANLSLLNSISSSSSSYTDLNPPSGTIIYYQIEVENPGSCIPTGKRSDYSASRSNIVNTAIIGIGASNNFRNVRVYPNPFMSFITIEIPDNAGSPCDLHLYDITGSKVVSYFNITENSFLLNRNMLSAGVFYIEIRDERGSYRQKIIAL